MRTRLLSRAGLAAIALVPLTALSTPEFTGRPPARDALGMEVGAVHLSSLGALAFNPDGLLFLADSRAAMLVAIDPAERGQASWPNGFETITDLDLKVAGLLGTTRDKVRFSDMARHPKTGSLYFSVNRLSDGGSHPALVRASSPDRIELVSLDNIKNSSTPLPAAPSADAKTRWGQPQWTLSITDLGFVDGELWVAGLSNEQFASALRRVPFPFGSKGQLTTVEIFHTSHNQWETASPITAFLPITLNGTPSLLAGYGCSPIATFTRGELKKGGHLRGRTVAELGGGNRPIDMIQYQKDGKSYVLIANSDRTLMRMDLSEIASAEPLTKGVDRAFVSAGVGYLAVSSAGVMRIADAPGSVTVLRRDTESGAVNVVSYDKQWL